MSKAITNIRNRITIPVGCRERFLDLSAQGGNVLSPLDVRLAGASELRRGYEIAYSDPPHRMVIATAAGSGWFLSGTTRLELPPRSLLIAPPGEPLAFGVAGKQWRIVWFYLLDRPTDERIARVVPVSPLADKLDHAMQGLLAESAWTAKQSLVTEAGWKQNDADRSKKRAQAEETIQESRRLYGRLVAEFLQQALAGSHTAIDDDRRRLDDLWREVHDRPEQPWNIDVLARRLHVSPPTLNRLVRRLEQASPRQMVVCIRMAVARQLLEQTNYPLSLIADRIGYADQFVFSTAFRNAVGCSPRAYRNAQRIPL